MCFSNSIDNIFYSFFPCRRTGIKGTKAYRKPSWVTQMEELREQLQGKRNVADLHNRVVGSMIISSNSSPSSAGAGVVTAEDYDVDGSSVAVMDIVDDVDDDDDEDEDDLHCLHRHRHLHYNGTYFAGYDVNSAFDLSPIQERSEPSSSDGGSADRPRSLSCRELSRSVGGDDPAGRSQTYPRSHADETVATYNRRRYRDQHHHHPLEPREIDPDMFFQLHTADSQEELQEFLLLESQCMTSADGGGGGLHAAFVDDVRRSQ